VIADDPVQLNLVSTFSDATQYLVCPVSHCGCEQVHLGKVQVIQNKDIWTVTSEGGAFDKAGGESRWRGSIIHIHAYCESGHCFDITFHFHKGTTSISAHNASNYEVGHDSHSELWRD